MYTCYSGSPAYMLLTFPFPILSSFHRGCSVGNCYPLLFQQWLRRQVTKQDSRNQKALVSFSISQLFPKAVQLPSLLFFFLLFSFGMIHQMPNQERNFGLKSGLDSGSPKVHFYFFQTNYIFQKDNLCSTIFPEDNRDGRWLGDFFLAFFQEVLCFIWLPSWELNKSSMQRLKSWR